MLLATIVVAGQILVLATSAGFLERNIPVVVADYLAADILVLDERAGFQMTKSVPAAVAMPAALVLKIR